MKLSIFTPTNNPKYLPEIFAILQDEKFQNWEWLIMPNGMAEVQEFDDHRVRVLRDYKELKNMEIGALKAKCCQHATGDVLIELDHDDYPVAGFMEKIAAAFEDPEVDFVYTNFAEFEDKSFKPRTYSPDCGWRYRDVEINGRKFQEALAPPAEPPYIIDITHCPNHFRCWRTSLYNEIGGHDWDLPVGDDFDIVVRTYLKARKIIHIPECLYLYRWTGNNSYIQRYEKLSEVVADRYGKYIFEIMLRWSNDKGLKAIDLGAAHSKADGFLGVDQYAAPGVDIQADLNKRWPFETDSVGVIRAFDFIEHIADKVHFMNEAWRVLAPGGAIIIHVPSSEGRGADQDPTHTSRWNENSFWYYCDNNYKKYCPEIACSFMKWRCFTFFPTDFHRQQNISYVQAHLFAVKDHGHEWGMPAPSMMPHPSKKEPIGPYTKALTHVDGYSKIGIKFLQQIVDAFNSSPKNMDMIDSDIMTDPDVDSSKLISLEVQQTDTGATLVGTYEINKA